MPPELEDDDLELDQREIDDLKVSLVESDHREIGSFTFLTKNILKAGADAQMMAR